jgi:hypothetical protein
LKNEIKNKREIIEIAKSQSRMPEERLFFMLGVSEFYKDKKDSKLKYSAPYEKIGREFYEEKKEWLYELICNPKTKKPKLKLLDNDWLPLAGALIGDMSYGTVATLIAILMKKGLDKFCRLDPQPKKKKAPGRPKKRT